MTVGELQALLETYDPQAEFFVFHGNGYDRYLAISDIQPMAYVHDAFTGERKYGVVVACYDDGRAQ